MTAALPTSEIGRLRQRLEEACGDEFSLGDLTVLAAVNDPYRRDTAAGHRDGRWFLEQYTQAVARRGGKPTIHIRGVHYAIVTSGRDVLRPNGQPYINDDACWSWLQNVAAKAARWLGYVAFDAIIDKRNDEPIIHRSDARPPATWQGSVYAGLEADKPSLSGFEPEAYLSSIPERQPYHLVIFGEKSSLEEIVVAVAKRFQADVYLPTGEISDTLLHRMARDAAADGRPMKVFTLSDCDPAGYQMPISIGRKLQALRDLYFTDLDFEVRPIGLTVEQVKELDLPSSPLKETEKRADRWRAAFGVEQTEIDALATLRPNVLRRIIRDAIAPFYDDTLQDRINKTRWAWTQEAQKIVDQHVNPDLLAELRERAAAAIRDFDAAAAIRDFDAAVADINDRLDTAVDGIVLPEAPIPTAQLNPALHVKALVSSRWTWTKQTIALKSHKAYGEEGDA